MVRRFGILKMIATTENFDMHGAVILTLIVFVLVMLLISPFALIWAINMLWDLSNPYDFNHWVAAFVVIMLLGASAAYKKD
jgi:hypothetical protein